MKPFLRRFLRVSSAVVLAISAVGCGNTTTAVGVGTITLTSIDLDSDPLPGPGNCTALTPGIPDAFPTYPTEFVITGLNFETVTGTSAKVTFTAVGGATPFLGGTSATVDVVGDVLSDTMICGTTPPVTICGVASVDATVQVTLESGVKDDSTSGPAFTITFTAPIVASFAPPLIPALTPVQFTVTGTFLGNVGDVVIVRLAATEETTPGVLHSIFADGTNSSIEAIGTVATTSGPPLFTTTVTGTTPKSTNEVLDVDGNPFHTLSDDLDDISVQTVLSNGTCSPAAPGLVQYDRPEGDSIAPATIPQTIATSFTITGSGTDEFGPVGAHVKVSFSAPGNPGVPALAFQLDAVTDLGTTDYDEVDGVITSATTIDAKTPRVRADANFTPVVRIHFEDGTIAPVTATFLWVAPPLVTSVVNTEAPGVQLSLVNTVGQFLGCRPSVANVNGANFQLGATLAIFDLNQGANRPIGAGTLAGLTVTPPLLIAGTSPSDPKLANLDPDGDRLVDTVWRVTNPDGQVSLPFSPVPFHTDTNSRPATPLGDGFTHNNTSIAVDPTNTRHLAIVTGHDSSTFSTFAATDVWLSVSSDGGATWTTSLLGSANDAFPAAAQRNFAMCAYDHLGNLWVSYLVDDFAGGTSSVVLLASFNQGASFLVANRAVLATTAATFVGSLDRPALAVGVNGSGAGDAAYVTWVDLQDPLAVHVHACGRPATALGAIGALSADTIVSDAAQGADGKFMAVPSVGPNGQLYVSWIVPSLNPGGAAAIRFDRDIDGLFAGTFGFSTDTAVGTSNVNFNLLISGTGDLGAILAPNHAVIATGAHKGRIVMAYTQATPFDGNNPQTSYAVTRYSDDFGFSWSAPDIVTHQVDPNDQWNPTIAADELTGVLYVAWYDTTNDPANQSAERYSAASADGVSWGDPQNQTDSGVSPSPATFTPSGDGEDTDYGYYDGLVARGGCVWATWGVEFGPRIAAANKAFQQTPAIPQNP